MPPMQSTSEAQSHHSPTVNNIQKPVCTGEDISRLISTNLHVLRKVLQVAIATHGVGPTRELVHEIFGESSVVTESVENNESSSLDDEEIHVLDTQDERPHIVNLEDPMVSTIHSFAQSTLCMLSLSHASRCRLLSMRHNYTPDKILHIHYLSTLSLLF